MIRNFTDDAHDITDDYGHELACRLLDHVRERMIGFQAETGHLYNLEATPAEGTTYRLAKRGPEALPGHPAGGHRGRALLHQLVAASGRVHRRSLRRARTPGGAAVALHRRHRHASVHGRTDFELRSLQDPGAPGAGTLPHALPDDHADLLHLPGARLPRRCPQVLSQMRRRDFLPASGPKPPETPLSWKEIHSCTAKFPFRKLPKSA